MGVVLIGPLLTLAYFYGTRHAEGGQVVRANTSEQQSGSRPTGAAPTSPNTNVSLHGTYLQLAAGPHPQNLLERLRKDGFPAVDVEIPGRPGVRRVLVGPLADNKIAAMRAELERKGLQGNAAIPRVF